MGYMSFPFRTDPIPGYRFIVFLDGLLMGFQKVSGIKREIETEVYREGGLNTRVHVLPKASSGEQKLLMEKGIYSGMEHPFCMVGERLAGSLNLIVMDSMGMPLKSYLFSGILVQQWEVGELRAEENSILLDRFEISYEEFQVVI